VSETRKLAAILAADVVGYSRLMGEDEAGTAKIVRERREVATPIVRSFGGRLVKTMGDGVLLEFPSVVAAVECAIAIQKMMAERNAAVPETKRILYRVGVNLGDVLIEGDDILGDGVNIAARLEGICEPGGVCLSSSAYEQVRGRIEAEFTDLGEQALKNIPRPVRAYALTPAAIAAVTTATPAPAAATDKATGRSTPKARALSPRLGVLAAALVIVLLAAGAYAWHLGIALRLLDMSAGDKLAAAPHLSIVVLPFTNLSGDPAQDYFADGVTENLTTELSRINGSFIIARNTAFTYKGRNVDAKNIGKELGVRYLLEGSVQRDQNRVRVNAQLIDAASGAHLWADRFEEDVADLFKLQDQAVARLSSALGYELVAAEATKGSLATNPDVVDLGMRGWSVLWRGFWQPPKERRENTYEARALFDRALQIDPNNSDALAGSAFTYFLEYYNAWADTGTDYEAKVLGQADRAIALSPENVRGYLADAFYLTFSRRPREGLAVADAGLAINPNFVMLLPPRIYAENSLGRFEQAKTDAQLAMRLSPRDPFLGLFHVGTGDAELSLGHSDAAIDQYRKAIDLGYRSFSAYANLSAAYALEGKMDEAKTALAEARRLNPKLTVKWMTQHTPSLPAVLDGLQKLGLPEE
jgi:TolB-like protein/class 3 adenylate cyclase